VNRVEVEVSVQLEDEARSDASGSFHGLRREALRIGGGHFELYGVAVAVVACTSTPTVTLRSLVTGKRT
jgi:hypothetical protein